MFRFFPHSCRACTLKDLTGETQFHDGPSYTTNSVARMGVIPVIPVVHRGANKPVEHFNLWRLPVSLSAAQCWAEFSPHWQRELEKPKYVKTETTHATVHKSFSPSSSFATPLSPLTFLFVLPSTCV